MTMYVISHVSKDSMSFWGSSWSKYVTLQAVLVIYTRFSLCSTVWRPRIFITSSVKCRSKMVEGSINSMTLFTRPQTVLRRHFLNSDHNVADTKSLFLQCSAILLKRVPVRTVWSYRLNMYLLNILTDFHKIPEQSYQRKRSISFQLRADTAIDHHFLFSFRSTLSWSFLFVQIIHHKTDVFSSSTSSPGRETRHLSNQPYNTNALTHRFQCFHYVWPPPPLKTNNFWTFLLVGTFYSIFSSSASHDWKIIPVTSWWDSFVNNWFFLNFLFFCASLSLSLRAANHI